MGHGQRKASKGLANRGLTTPLAFFLLLLLPGLAWATPTPATPCAEQPYTLETPEGLAGGGNLEYDGEVAIFSDGACLETQGLTLKAPELRYDQSKGELNAQNIEVQTPRYRFFAEVGVVREKVLQAQGIRATPCRCGDDLRLLSQTLRFDTQSGEIVLEESQLEVYRFGLTRFQELRLDPNQPLNETLGLGAAPPIRLDYDQGWNLGLENFPLLEARLSPETPLTHLTLLGLGLGGPDPVLRLGLSVREKSRQARFELDYKPSGVASRGEGVEGPIFFQHDSEKGRYAFGFKQALALGAFTLTPFAWIAQDWPDGTPASQTQGLAAGAELRYRYALEEGPWRFGLEPFAVMGLYDPPQPYLAYGGYTEARYRGAFDLRLGYAWAEATPGRFWLERREASQKLSGSLQYQNLRLEAEHDFLKAQTQGSLRLGYTQDFGQVWAQLNGCWGCVGKTLSNGRDDWERRELVLGFTPRPLECTEAISLAPFLGYDFLRQGVSRWGLELRYADCCFVWRLGYQETRIAQHPDEAASGKLTFGLEIR